MTLAARKPHELTRPAENLREALVLFPPQPLAGAQLNAFYVDRGSRARSRMRVMLDQGIESGAPVKMLFTGHRGSGKSTELNRLSEELDNRFFISKISTSKIVQPLDLSYVDVLLIAATGLYHDALEQGIIERAPAQSARDLIDQFRSVIQRRIFGDEVRLPPTGETGVSLELALIAKFEASYKSEANTRAVIRRRAEDNLADIIEQINLLCMRIQLTTGKPVLMIFDDTDKPDPAQAEKIFFDHPGALTSFNASLIYSFPINLWYSPKFSSFKDYFAGSYRLPNVALHKRDDTENAVGHRVLDAMIDHRLQPALIDLAARKLLILKSGGLARELISLVRFAAVDALGRGVNKIELQDAERAVEERRKDFTAALEERDYPVLAARHADKRLSSDAHIQELLYSLALLEYENGDTWCDVHPIALDLVIERVSSREGIDL